ncbi:MAG: DUF3604 domain-containing protein [Hellea sp.]|nr:DUF3604 domain-containing protein [Hellea sp.]
MKNLLGLSCAVIALTACGQEGGGDDATSKTQPVPAATISNDSADSGADGFATNVYFGDTHIHTKNSFDAYIFNVRNTPDDVYRFAKGETIRHPAGYEISLWGDPLDFVAATDHGAYMGILPAMNDPESPLSEVEWAKDMFGTDPDKVTGAFGKMGGSVRSGVPYPEVYDRDLIDATWQNAIDVANKHYEPGKLTTFAAYEYTAVTQGRHGGNDFIGGNLHRNVVFKDSAPDRLFATLDSVNPEDLWDWMDSQRATGNEVLAIPHNSNVSDGEMFDLMTFDGDPLTAEYAAQRMRNEPIVEMTQVKGTSETHPALSPNDEWADFEIYEYLLSSTVKSRINGSYIRESLARGIEIEQDIGVNPYKFGLIGASDSHVAGGAFDEKNYWSKVGILDATPETRGSVPPGGKKTWEGVELPTHSEYWFPYWGASGLAAVWAPENTREAIFDGMARKETYATTGPRIKVRMFGGYDYDAELLGDSDLVNKAYAGGVPMGGTLEKNDEAPGFVVWAARDARSAPLQRIQLVKVWHADGKAQEMLYDIGCSDGLSPDPVTHRCPDNGASVDLSNCSISTDAGDPEIKTFWQDPDFDSSISAAYYVRVLENPTCRWSTWDALRAGTPPNPNHPTTLQERAYTSPIWYDAK